mmetsp:Transcript_15522/g.43023  ORF Transcript_15522/g.43023 Transcript_15522/m.43023 type:complete len:230 (+) Transcript_15522:544-1233(+)
MWPVAGPLSRQGAGRARLGTFDVHWQIHSKGKRPSGKRHTRRRETSQGLWGFVRSRLRLGGPGHGGVRSTSTGRRYVPGRRRRKKDGAGTRGPEGGGSNERNQIGSPPLSGVVERRHLRRPNPGILRWHACLCSGTCHHRSLHRGGFQRGTGADYVLSGLEGRPGTIPRRFSPASTGGEFLLPVQRHVCGRPRYFAGRRTGCGVRRQRGRFQSKGLRSRRVQAQRSRGL